MSIITIGLLIAGLVLLVGGAELLVRGASRLAAAFGISPLVIGLTVVAFGTSSPELAVSLQSALSGDGQIAVGNVVGSNIFNILMIIGLAALITPLVVEQQLVRKDVPLMIGLSFLLYGLGLTGRISRLQGLLMFAGLIAYIAFSIWQSRKESAAVQAEYEESYGDGQQTHHIRNILFLLVGLVLLVVGSNWLVDSASAIARAFGISELIIGLTIVAAGTSMPELATSTLAAIRGERDIAVGNAVGSNIFNILCVLALTAVISPDGLIISPDAMSLDIPFMVAVAIAALPIFFTGYRISRWEGAVFVLYYGAYTLFLLLESAQHDRLARYSTIMLEFVLPLTALTLIIVVVREFRARRNGRPRATV
ncbi:MAG: calcium/sodium antiporter [Caldilineales bacterium]